MARNNKNKSKNGAASTDETKTPPVSPAPPAPPAPPEPTPPAPPEPTPPAPGLTPNLDELQEKAESKPVQKKSFKVVAKPEIELKIEATDYMDAFKQAEEMKLKDFINLQNTVILG